MKVLLLSLTILLSVTICAQQYTKEQQITWNNKQTINISDFTSSNLLSFDQANYNVVNQLPAISYTFPLLDQVSPESIIIKLDEIQSTNLTTQELSAFNALTNDFKQYDYSIVTIRKEKNIQIIVYPFSINPDTKSIQKITSFKLHISHTPKAQPTLKNLKTNEASLLSSGKWVRVKTTATGIYKIPYSTLTSWGFDNPSIVNIYGDGGAMLPKKNPETLNDNLIKNNIWHYDGAIYFYAQNAITWKYNTIKKLYEHEIHDYTNDIFYYLSDIDPTTSPINEITETTSNITTNETDSYAFHETNTILPIHSGRMWLGEEFNKSTVTRTFNFDFPNLVTSKPITVSTRLVSRSDVSNNFKLSVNNSTPQQLDFIKTPEVTNPQGTSEYAISNSFSPSFTGTKGNNEIKLEYSVPSDKSKGWLDYLCVNAKETIAMGNKSQIFIRNKDVAAPSNITYFKVDLSANSVTWDVTNPVKPIKITNKPDGFIVSTPTVKEFVVFNPSSSLPQPTFIENITNQNLKGIDVPEMLIISHPDFIDQAKRLANLHLENSGLKTEIVTQQQIYNEFSSGKPDVSAIRDYCRYLLEKSVSADKSKTQFKYLLLFGDGSYDNRSTDASNTNKIITYQSKESLRYDATITVDDFFGMLDAGEGGDNTITSDKLDIGIGRLPANSIEQATIMVNKVESYLKLQQLGIWKSNITFVGDDGDNNLHMRDANKLADQVQNEHPEYNTNKIFLDAYKKITTSSGASYPEVNELIKNTIADGTLVFNYTGHGGEHGLAHEQILTINDIQKWSNKDRLPLFVTATCELSRYDKKDIISAGEWVLLNPFGGGIALLTTTRVAYADQNYDLNKNVYNYLFKKDDDGNALRLGEVVRLTKNSTNNTNNKLNFTLLGDPALRLAYPQNNISLKSLNGESSSEKLDTLKALSNNKITGTIDTPMEEGQVFMTIYDKPTTVTTLNNSGQGAFTYQVYKNKVFKGTTATTENGEFNVSFVIPKDIRLNVDNGRITYYAADKNRLEAIGSTVNIKIGDVSNALISDNEGPKIKIWFNDKLYTTVGPTSNQAIMTVELEDEHGINTSGIGIGHDITLVIDNNKTETKVLNSLYYTQNNNYKKGSLTYQLPDLSPGEHTLQFKAWDNANNSTSTDIHFNINNKGELEIKNLYVGPNPLEAGRELLVSFEHDAPNSFLNVTTRVFSLDGQLIDMTNNQIPSNGVTSTPLTWRPSDNIKKGLYLINYDVKTEDGQSANFTKKIIILK